VRCDRASESTAATTLIPVKQKHGEKKGIKETSSRLLYELKFRLVELYTVSSIYILKHIVEDYTTHASHPHPLSLRGDLENKK